MGVGGRDRGAAGRRGRLRAAAGRKFPGFGEPVSAARRWAGPGRPRGPGAPLERSARGVADEVNLARPLEVGEPRAGLRGGGRGPRRLFRAAPRAPCARTWGRPQRQRSPLCRRSGEDASGAHPPPDAGRAALFRAARPRPAPTPDGPRPRSREVPAR